MGLAFSDAPHMADAFPDDDASAVMATPGPTGLAPIMAPNPPINPRCLQGCGRWAGPGKPKRLNIV